MIGYEALAADYTNEHYRAADAWRLSHYDDYLLLLENTMRDYRGERGGWARRMDIVIRKCADLAGFPTFSDWLAAKYPAERVA